MQVLGDSVPACPGFADRASVAIFDNLSHHSVWLLCSVTKSRLLTAPLNPKLFWGAGLYIMNEQTYNTSWTQKKGQEVTLLQGGQGCSSSARKVTSWGKAPASRNALALVSSTQYWGTVNTQAAPTPDLWFAGVSHCFAKQERLSTQKQSPAPLLLVSAPSTHAFQQHCLFAV